MISFVILRKDSREDNEILFAMQQLLGPHFLMS
jgi:hypothetical protein